MATQTVDALVEGGKATAAPPLGPALGPLGVNIGQVVAEINRKTASFKGMQVPVKVSVNDQTKEFSITVGTPPASALIRKEAGIAKGAANPLTDKLADLKIQQIIKIAKMKEDGLQGRTMKERVKTIIGTCNSMGVLVEGKAAVDTIAEINAGAFAKEIAEERTELTAEELKALEEERKKLAEDMEKRRAEFMTHAKSIIEENAGKTRSQLKTKLAEAGIPSMIAEEVLPAEEGAGDAKKKEVPAKK